MMEYTWPQAAVMIAAIIAMVFVYWLNMKDD